MGHPHGLVQQTMTVDATALGTLAGRTTLQLNADVASTTAAFLMKRVRYLVQLVGRTIADDGPLLIGVAKGDATLA